MALPLVVDAFCTLEANSKVKAPMRHVLIRDLGKVAVALKQPPLEEPSALLVLVDGDPSASDFCARQMHTRLLKRLAARAKPSAALGGAILDLDAELRSQRPGMPGTSCCAALFVGRQLHVVVAGNCAGMLWGEGLAAAATATSSASEIGKDGVMRRSGKETPQQKRAKALLKLRAARPTEQIGGSVALPGGRRPGAQAVQSAGAGAVKAQNARSAGAGGEAALRAEDLLLETVELSPGEHSLLVLSSAGLFASFSPQDVGNIAGACAPDAAKASQVLAEQAKDRLKEASKGEANWQKQEKAAASEVACVTALLCWGEGEEPQAKKPRTE